MELGAKQIVASDKHCIVLTMSGLVYSLQAKSSGEYSATVSNGVYCMFRVHLTSRSTELPLWVGLMQALSIHKYLVRP